MKVVIMKRAFTLSLLFCLMITVVSAQYEFKDEIRIACTPVKSQDKTGTCWSFATTSFLESELMRQNNQKLDLSEMFIVRNIYLDKARNYLFRQGKANFSQGSLSHDVMRAAAMYGVVPESAFSGSLNEAQYHDHSEMVSALKGMLDGILKKDILSDKWQGAVDAVLTVYMGDVPDKFEVNGKRYSPGSYANELGLTLDDYVSITSFSHHPFNEKFILEIPDNYSNGSFYNLPLDEMQAIVDNALASGYTIAWDGDVSEVGFSAKQGIAVLPKDEKREDLFTQPGEEISVQQGNRQQMFESLVTTDDHLMHLIGTASDKSGNKYYIIKNSWGEVGPFDGYIYMSEPYFRAKTISVMVHKGAIPADIARKMGV